MLSSFFKVSYTEGSAFFQACPNNFSMIIICDEVNGYDDNDEGLILTSKNSMILPMWS